MLPWPAYARIQVAGYRLGWTAPVARTQLDDGMVRQARRGLAMQRTIDCTVLIDSDADRARFETWAAGLDNDWLLLPAGLGGPERAPRLARIAGGRGGVRWTAVVAPSLRRRWRAELRLESPERYGYRDLWDPLLPLGHQSHVYMRWSSPRTALRMSSGYPQIDFVSPAVGGSEAPAIAPHLIVGGGVAYWNALWIRILGRIGFEPLTMTLGVTRRDISEGAFQGPSFVAAALPGLRLAFRLRAATYLSPSIGDTGASVRDEDEPYAFGQGDVAASDAFFVPLVGDPSLVLSCALVWTGAGSVIDTASLRSVPIGQPPVL